MFKEFIKNNIVNISASIIVGIGNWLFRFLILKFTPPDSSTSFASFSALLLIFSFPGTWITLMTIRLGIKFKEKFNNHIKKSMFLFISIFLSASILLGYIFIISKFAFGFYILAIILIVVGLLGSYYRGLLHHEMLFDKLGFVGIIEVIVKIIIFLLFINLNQKTLAMFIASTLQSIITLIILYYLTIRLKSHYDEENITKIGILTLFYSLSFLFLTNLDTVFARIFLKVDQNLSYIGISQLSNLILFGSAALINVLLPSIQKYRDKLQIIKLSFSTGILVILGGSMVLLFTILEYPRVSSLFNFTMISKPLALTYLLSIILLSLAQIPLTILLVKGKKDMVYIVIISTIIQFISYIFFGRSLKTFIIIYAIVSIMLLVLGIISLVRYNLRVTK